MKELVKYEATDGMIFDGKEECEKYESYLRLFEAIRGIENFDVAWLRFMTLIRQFTADLKVLGPPLKDYTPDNFPQEYYQGYKGIWWLWWDFACIDPADGKKYSCPAEKLMTA